MPSMSSETLQTPALIPNCDTHVLNNVFNVITYLVKQMSANSIHVILINVIQNAEANLFFKINCATVTKNIKLHILQNKSKQISNHILLKTAYTQHNITRFSKIILHDLPFLAYEHSEGKRAAVQPTSIVHETRNLHHKKLYELTLSK